MKTHKQFPMNVKPLCPTVIGSSAFPGWYTHFLSEVKRSPESFGEDDLNEAWRDAVRICLDDQITAGIELVTDGEMGRVDFNLGFYDYLQGIVPQPAPRQLGAPAHDQRGKYLVVEPITAPKGLGTLAEFEHLKSITNLPIKMPVPGPYTLAGRLDGGDVFSDRREITESLIKIVNNEMAILADAGCKFIQLDEPSFACHPEHPEEFIEVLNKSIEGLDDVFVSIHMCFGNFRGRAIAHRSYIPLFPHLLQCNVDQFALEFASREMAEIDILGEISEAGKSIAVGIVDVKNLWTEPVELLESRIRTCLKYAPPELLHLTPDCGFSQTARYAARTKMKNLAEAARNVRSALKLT